VGIEDRLHAGAVSLRPDLEPRPQLADRLDDADWEGQAEADHAIGMRDPIVMIGARTRLARAITVVTFRRIGRRRRDREVMPRHRYYGNSPPWCCRPDPQHKDEGPRNQPVQRIPRHCPSI
jgi:hypothetical protein